MFKLTRKPIVQLHHSSYHHIRLVYNSSKSTSNNFRVHSRMSLKMLIGKNCLTHDGQQYDLNDFIAVPLMTYRSVWLYAALHGLATLFILAFFGLAQHSDVAILVACFALIRNNHLHAKDNKLAKTFNRSDRVTILTKTEQQ